MSAAAHHIHSAAPGMLGVADEKAKEIAVCIACGRHREGVVHAESIRKGGREVQGFSALPQTLRA